MSVRIGIGPGLTAALSSRDYWRWAVFCEESGIDSLWYSDQLLGPAAEPLTMLAALAGVTRRMHFGMSALVLPFRDPLLLAKQCATIDFISPGRLLPVFGVGVAKDPVWAATDRSPGGRGTLADEAIDLFRRLLTQEQVSFRGTHFRYEGPGVQPRPAQLMPIWIGGESDAAIRRTAAIGDGWLGGLTNPSRTAEVVAGIKAALVINGRAIDPDHYGVSLPFRFGDADDPIVVATRARLHGRISGAEHGGDAAEGFAIGDAAAIADLFRRYVEVGVSKFVALPIARDGEDLLVQTRWLAERILPAIEG